MVVTASPSSLKYVAKGRADYFAIAKLAVEQDAFALKWVDATRLDDTGAIAKLAKLALAQMPITHSDYGRLARIALPHLVSDEQDRKWYIAYCSGAGSLAASQADRLVALQTVLDMVAAVAKAQDAPEEEEVDDEETIEWLTSNRNRAVLDLVVVGANAWLAHFTPAHWPR